ncbi:MAG: 2-oxo acid dehydrogenase subunit E2 [Acidimicrobiales bacterium]|nr:2-oxo acid dehydrogenase subunit E2 [Acidimicrobiales bacterium]
MAVVFRVPALGQSATEATVLRWLAGPGDTVAAGQPIVLIETDKAELEVEAPVGGVLGLALVAEGRTVPVGTDLGTVLAPGEAEPSVVATAPPPSSPRLSLVPPAVEATDRVVASPKARRLAAERGVDLSGLVPSGPDGLLVAADVPEAGAAPAAPVPTAVPVGAGRLVRDRAPLSAARRVTARRLTASWTSAPHFVQIVDVEVTRLASLRAGWRARGGPLATVSWTDLVVAATARALAEHPDVNAVIEGDELVRFADVHVGVAVERPHGLIVPVIADADRRTLPELAERIRALAAGGEGDDVAGSITVSNLGAYGIRAGTPVLNPPEAALVFVGAVEDRVVARNGVPSVRPMVTLSVAFDHRVVDGATAARFVASIRDRLEHPDRYL